MKALRLLGLSLLAGLALSTRLQAAEPVEAFVKEPMPPGFQVVVAEMEGPVFADRNGKTLYYWPQHSLAGGEQAGVSRCLNTKYEKGAEGGYGYPNYLLSGDERVTCTQAWPPVL